MTTPTELAGPGPTRGEWRERPPGIQDSTAGRRINLPDAEALNPTRGGALLEKSTMVHAGRGRLGAQTKDRYEHERPHDASVPFAMLMEVLIELLLVIGGVIVAAALLPLRPKVRLVLSCYGLVLVAVGGALFAFVAYTGETLLFVGAGAGIAGTAWGYAQVTAWLARRAASAITLSNSASEPGGQS